jgi:hypothetical protein
MKHGFVYFLKGTNNVVKIGKSRREPDVRIAEYSPLLPFETELLRVVETEDVDKTEIDYHQFYEEQHVRGEWFQMTDENLAEIQDGEMEPYFSYPNEYH